MDGLNFKILSERGKVGLVKPFSLEEIKDVVWNCDGDKSPGPDGFNFTFFKKFWESIKDELKVVVEEFHSNESLPKGVCSSFVALIPKRENPHRLNDFRSISLIGSIHKLKDFGS